MHPHINTFIPVFITEYGPLKQPLGNIILYVQSLDRKLKLLLCFTTELCLTSNVKTKTVLSYSEHHMGYWYSKQHPCIVCVSIHIQHYHLFVLHIPRQTS